MSLIDRQKELEDYRQTVLFPLYLKKESGSALTKEEAVALEEGTLSSKGNVPWLIRTARFKEFTKGQKGALLASTKEIVFRGKRSSKDIGRTLAHEIGHMKNPSLSSVRLSPKQHFKEELTAAYFSLMLDPSDSGRRKDIKELKYSAIMEVSPRDIRKIERRVIAKLGFTGRPVLVDEETKW